jgi:hypothetical protein
MSDQQSVDFYNLFLGHQNHMAPKLVDQGISLEAEKLVYPINGKLGTSLYSDIVEVRLLQGYDGLRTIGICLIRFASGSHLCVTSLEPTGAKGKIRNNSRYRDFVTTFHRQLIANGVAAKAKFSRGTTPRRSFALVLFLILGATAMVLMTQWLPTTTRPGRLWVALIGGALCMPFIIANCVKNWPQPYSAAVPPEVL